MTTIMTSRILKRDSVQQTISVPRQRVTSDLLPDDVHFEPLPYVQGLSFQESQTTTISSPVLPALDDLKSATAAMRVAAEKLIDLRDSCLDQCQHETVKLGIAIAERLLRRSLQAQPELIVGLAQSALSWAVGSECVRLRMHPEDCELVQSQQGSLRQNSTAAVELISDSTLRRGDCVVESETSQVDARLSTMLDRIVEELLNSPHANE